MPEEKNFEDYCREEMQEIEKPHYRTFHIKPEEFALFLELTEKAVHHYDKINEIEMLEYAVYVHNMAIEYQKEEGDTIIILDYGTLAALAEMADYIAFGDYSTLDKGMNIPNLYQRRRNREKQNKKMEMAHTISIRAKLAKDDIMQEIMRKVYQNRQRLYEAIREKEEKRKEYAKKLEEQTI